MASYRLLAILVFSALVSARRSAADSYLADCPYPCLLPPPMPVTNCPPPPSTPSTYTYPPPSSYSNTPSSYWNYPPPQGGYIPNYQPPAGGGYNYPAPPPPNPIVPWYPWYYRPPPSSATATSSGRGRPFLVSVTVVTAAVALITVF
ncbi:hypothetical protein ABZP36_015844 [Zizania latifolia]